jgi:nucleoid-associated protein YgaU
MGFNTFSRYFGQPVVMVPTDTAGDMTKTVFGPPPTGPVNFAYYTVVAGDRFDTISFKVYGDPGFWWKIANANPEIFYPDYLVTGAIIRIPTSS